MFSKIFNTLRAHRWELDAEKTRNSISGEYFTDAKTGDRKVILMNHEFNIPPDRKWLSQGSGKWLEEDSGKQHWFKVPAGTYPHSSAADRTKGPAA